MKIACVGCAGYGAASTDTRPRGVPEDWVLRTERIPGTVGTYEEAAARVAAMEDRLAAQGYYPHGWTIPEDPLAGTYGPAEVTYWSPPEEKEGTERIIGLVLGMAGVGLCGIGMLIGLMESQR